MSMRLDLPPANAANSMGSPKSPRINHTANLLGGAERGDIHLVVTSLDAFNEVDLNAVDDYGKTALMLAAEKGHLKIVKLLLTGKETYKSPTSQNVETINIDLSSRKADADFITPPTSPYTENALTLAVQNNHEDIVHFLLEYNQKLNLNFISDSGTALMIACKNGNIDIVKQLLDHRADPLIELAGYPGFTALLYAVERNAMDIVKWMVGSGVDINHRTKLAQLNALMIAAENGHFELVKYICETRGMINAQSSSKETALILAAARGYVDICIYLIEKGADINVQTDNFGHGTALIAAAKIGCIDVVKKLIEKKANLNLSDNQGNESSGTALMKAIINGLPDVAKLLIEAKADLNFKNLDGDTAIIKAAEYGQVNTVKLLKQYRCETNVANAATSSTALMKAVEFGHTEVVKVLLETSLLDTLMIAGAEVNHQNSYNGSTALTMAAKAGHFEIAKMLISHRADVNLYKDGESALNLATVGGHIQIVKLLLDTQRVNLNVKSTTSGETALISAAAGNYLEIVKMLVEARAELNTQAAYGSYTALIKAAENGNVEMVKLLLGAKADISISAVGSTYGGHTALTIAAERNQSEIVALLLNVDKAAVNHQLTNGATALIKAAEKMHVETINVLLVAQADVNLKAEFGVETALLAAAFAIHPQNAIVVEKLLDNRADVDAADKLGFTPIMKAALNNNVSVIKRLIHRHANINLRNNEGTTALHIASQRNYYDVVEALIEEQVDLDAQNNLGYSAFLYACEANAHSIVTLLISHGANINIANKEGMTGLMIAAFNGYDSIVKILLHNESQRVQVDATNLEGHSALMLASRVGSYDIVKALLEGKADANTLSKKSETALMFAAVSGYKEICKLLLDFKANVNVQTTDEEQATALIGASRSGFSEIVKMLLAAKADANAVSKDRQTALIWASTQNHLEVVKQLLHSENFFGFLSTPINVNAVNSVGWSALLYAASFGFKDIAKLLIDAGADCNVKDPQEHHTPVLRAAWGNHKEILQLLLAHKNIDVNVPELKTGETALMKACANGDVEITQLLLEHKANANLRSLDNGTAFHSAARSTNSLEIMKLLRPKVTDIDIEGTEDKCTPLFLACANGELESVQFLLQNQAIVNTKDKDGNTPLMTAAGFGSPEVVKLLLENNADSKFQNKEGVFALLEAASTLCVENVKKLVYSYSNAINLADSNYETPLMRAAGINCLQSVQFLLQNGASVNLQAKDKSTALIKAIDCYDSTFSNFSIEVIRVLIEAGANVDLQNEVGETALYIAVRKGHDNIIRMLLAAKANVNLATKIGKTCFMETASDGSIDGDDKLLLNAGADVSACTVDGDTAVLLAAGTVKKWEFIKYLLDLSGRNLEIRNKAGETPLLKAAANGSIEVCKYLLSCKADATVKSNTGNTPLICGAGTSELVRLFLTTKVDVNSVGDKGLSALLRAVEKENLESVKLLLDAKAFVNSRSQDGDSALIKAARIANPDKSMKMIQLLINAKADLQVLNKKAESVLTVAVMKGDLKLIDFLIGEKCDLKVINSKGDNILMIAVRAGKLEVVKKLLGYPTIQRDLNSLNKNAQSALIIGCESNHTEPEKKMYASEIVKLLLAEKANVNLKEKNTEETALMKAARFGNVDTVQLLIDANADPSKVNKEGKNAYQIALQHKHTDIARLLKDITKDPTDSLVSAVKLLIKPKTDASIKVPEPYKPGKIIKVEIKSFEDESNPNMFGSAVTYYTLEVYSEDDPETYLLRKRYTDFEDIYRRLTSVSSKGTKVESLKIFEFPQKYSLTSGSSKDERKKRFNNFLKLLVDALPNPDIEDFLDFWKN